MTSEFSWWQQGVIYQVYPRSFKDTNGDGVGDLQGIIEKLDYLNGGTPDSLGVNAIWISPMFPSPMKDFGYDIADYCDVDPMFGDLAIFDRLVAEAHQRGIKIILDYVPNHTSDQHSWFQESRSSRDNPRHDWYIWKDAKPDGSPPNNWGGVFGGKAWTWDATRQQYYFHQFDPGQPDLNWRNPDVRAAMLDVLRFWMRRGVDGFRMDVIYMVWKHPDMPDQPIIAGALGRGENDIYGRQAQIYSQNYDGIHAIMRDIRATLDEFEDTFSVGEIWLDLPERVKFYGTPDALELHMPFNFGLIGEASFLEQSPWNAVNVRAIVDAYENALPAHGWGNWVLGNHDVSRLASRLGSEARARLAAMLLLTMRGTPTIYMGEEIGMINGEIPDALIQDPQGIILGAALTRDKCRTPMQWDASANAGFGAAEPWLPANPDYMTRNVAAQLNDPSSMLTLYRHLIRTRHASQALAVGSYRSLDTGAGVYAYLRQHTDETMLVALNFTAESLDIILPNVGQIVLSTYLDHAGDAVKSVLTLRPDEGVIIRLG
jgi:alpha-glucosidase